MVPTPELLPSRIELSLSALQAGPSNQAVLNLLRLTDHLVNFVSVRGPRRPSREKPFSLSRNALSKLPKKLYFFSSYQLHLTYYYVYTTMSPIIMAAFY